MSPIFTLRQICKSLSAKVKGEMWAMMSPSAKAKTQCGVGQGRGETDNTRTRRAGEFLFSSLEQSKQVTKQPQGGRAYLGSWSQTPQPVIPGFAGSGSVMWQSIVTDSRIVCEMSHRSVRQEGARNEIPYKLALVTYFLPLGPASLNLLKRCHLLWAQPLTHEAF